MRFIRHDVYWDFHVPIYENYWCEGVWNHNTTTAGMMKLVNFLLSQKPPRRDTPFWIIGESYEQICEVTWKEKLWGMHFLPHDEVDYARIRWRDRNLGHPYFVPLRPWEDDPTRNWCIEFKSYGQGREQFQGRSIGGFCFVEQFPWSLLKETLARCREYNFPGSMMAEFTPVDPILSLQLQEMMEAGTLPKGWGVYRANTECAMEAGHVDPVWFESFFGSMDEAERAVRLTGAWASFEGQVFPTFNPLVHNVTLEEVYSHEGDFPINVQHRRAIDWGFSQEHAFVCVWGYWHPDTHSWVIYDEYHSVDQRLTVIDHLGRISDRHDWKEDGYHGATYADPSRPDCIRIASKLEDYEYLDPITGKMKKAKSIPIQSASNAVYEGNDHVRCQLRNHVQTGKPMLRICKETCPNLWRQMQTYRYERSNESGLNPRAARQSVLKRDDDAVDALRYLVFSDARHQGITIEQIAHKPSAAGRMVQLARSR